jgi:hypothetical protein
MVLRAREPQVFKDAKLASGAVDFVQSSQKTTLADLSLEELADRYSQVDIQSHMMKGLILLEARNRFASDKEFGQWVEATVTLCDSRMNRSRLMHYAKFFKDRDATGISLTAGYLIASPANEDIAEVVYSIVQGQDLPVEEVKQIILKTKGIPELKTTQKSINKNQAEKKVINIVHQFEKAEAIEILENCLQSVKQTSED